MAVSIYAIYAQPEMVFQPTKGSGCLTGLTLSHTPASPPDYNLTNVLALRRVRFQCLRLRTVD